MNVRLAAQVLSETVGKVLLVTGSAEVAATANLYLMMDKFFDCLNVRNTEEHKIKLKSFLRPYSNVNDVSFVWLDGFFSTWKIGKGPLRREKEISVSEIARRCSYHGKHMTGSE